uniref:C3H1-type domain-containing protein n=1 Tax=Salix viminalis TaxID=40686 RepID=A0A6N2LTT1_SALVM
MEQLNKSVNKDSMIVTYLRGGAGSPIKSPASDRFSSNYQRSSSSNRSGSSRSPLSPLESVNAPMMAADEVLVMDGVLVSSVVGSGSSSNSCSSGKSVHKKELCRAWEDLGHCRYAASCQDTTSISPITISSEKFSKNSTTPISTPDHFLRTYISTRPEPCNKSPAASIKSEDSVMVFTATISSDNWSPQDDGIEIALPRQTGKCISREEGDAYIHSVLYGPATKKRLPVFSELCPG